MERLSGLKERPRTAADSVMVIDRETASRLGITASTIGIEITTTMPVRRPSETRLTTSTIATASPTDLTNSSTECLTA